MRIVPKAVLAALALTGSVMTLSAPANAQVSAYIGVGGDPGYGAYYGSDPYAEPYYADPYDSAYADPYACDYYEPPWGYPPDYCAYQIWQEPIYVGGLWYSGPIYYRGFGADRSFWLNGGWHRDEWRGSRPGRIDWGRNMRWSGPVHHFTGGNWNRGGNFASHTRTGRNWNGGNFNRGSERGRDFAAPQVGGQRQAFQGGENFRGRFGGANGAAREGARTNFVRPGNAANTSNLRGRFGGQSFAARGQGGSSHFGGQAGPRAGAGAQRGGEHGQGHRGH
jgi:hypothetical protein